MWAKLDDKLPRHPKVLAAAHCLGGKYARVRVLGTLSDVFCYCAEYLTGGQFPTDAIGQLADPEAVAVLDALTTVPPGGRYTAGFLVKTTAGYQVHDYEDENPDADAEKQRRKREAERKRLARAKARAGEQLALALDRPSEPTAPDATRTHHTDNPDMSADSPRTVRPDIPDVSRGRPEGASRERTRAGVIVPSRPVPSRSQSRTQEQRFARRVLTKLAHVVLDEVEAGQLDVLDVPEELKLRAARARLEYTAEAIGQARDSAAVQRRRRHA